MAGGAMRRPLPRKVPRWVRLWCYFNRPWRRSSEATALDMGNMAGVRWLAGQAPRRRR